VTPRTPFEDTSVPVARSQDQIRKQLRTAGADGVGFTEEWGDPPTLSVRFVWPLGNARQVVRLRVHPLSADRRHSTEQRERQAWRGLAHYLEGTLKAATFGLIRFEDVFLSFMELEPMGRTLGEVVIPQIEQGQLALPAAA
jgi:hypothetical protein